MNLDNLQNISHVYKGLIQRNRAFASFREKEELETIYSDLKQYISDEDTILDPMSGYGGGMLFFGKKGYRTTNIEINPPEYYWQLLINPQNTKEILAIIGQMKKEKIKLPKYKEAFSLIDNLFSDEAIRNIKTLYRIIVEYSNNNTDLSIALLLPFVSRFANYQKSKTNITHFKQGGLCTYVGWEEDFQNYLNIIHKRLSEDFVKYKQTEHINILSDIMKVDMIDKFSCFVTSPPYPNYRDYSKLFKIENWVLDNIILEKPTDFNMMIGSNNVSGKKYGEIHSEKKNNLPEEIQKQLNIGLEATEKHFETQSWLPNKESFSYRDGFPDKSPIVINWLISNKCFFKCNYCYASDVIGQEFDVRAAKDIANDILKTHPLAVVLSGGEPLREREKMIDALNVLGNKVGIIVDTNGYNYDEELTNLFEKYNAVVRVSLDTLNNELNKKIRPLENQKQDDNVLDNIIGNILAYRKKKIPVLIHTVVSTVNKSLDDLYDNLPRLGLNGWRLFSIITPNNKERQEQFDKMMSFGKAKSTKEAKDDIKDKFEKIYKKLYVSKSNFSVQVVPTSESAKNSVILVLPDGKFKTESMFRNDKTEIDL